jgi:hypothetical protein
MKRSTLLKVAAALGLAAGIATPVSAQVSSGLQQAAFGGTIGVGGALTPAATGFSALSTAGSTSTTVLEGATPGQQVSSSTTKTTGSGGKVGTFQTSLSEGEQQRFAVGTSTNIGVNASSSSTSDYQANSSATFGIGTSNLRQTIGTSGISQTSQAREQASSSYADTSVGSSASSYFEKAKREIATDSSASQRYSWWNSGMATKSYDEAKTITTSGQSIDTSYTSAHGNAKSEYSSSASAAEASNGVISGSFVSNSSSSPSAADPTTEAATNQVTVKGIGNAASVNAMSNSSFSSVITSRAGTPAAGTSGTANGSAGANVSSTASADAASTKFSSVFIQAY